jgi:hypothetical protein
MRRSVRLRVQIIWILNGRASAARLRPDSEDRLGGP